MSLAIVHSRAQVGIEAPAVTVEAHLANGLPALTLLAPWRAADRSHGPAGRCCDHAGSNVVNTFFALMNKVPHQPKR